MNKEEVRQGNQLIILYYLYCPSLNEIRNNRKWTDYLGGKKLIADDYYKTMHFYARIQEQFNVCVINS